MKFKETIGDLRRRQLSGQTYQPLRTFAELCQELGELERVVRGKLRSTNAPKPKLVHRSNGAGQRSYYDPQEFKAWWAANK